MLTIFQVADWFLSHESMTHKKLQKLCYYAQAWYVALYDGTPLFNETIRAWRHGPVSRELFEKYRTYRYFDIPKITDLKVEFDTKAETILNMVYNSYKDYTADELERLTHKELPWIEARGNLGPDEYCNAEIQIPVMREFYFEEFKKGQND